MELTDLLSASRRTLLGASASLLAAGPSAAATRTDEADAQRELERYHAFGYKASGGPGDTASGEWLEGELRSLGFACERQAFDMPALQICDGFGDNFAVFSETKPEAGCGLTMHGVEDVCCKTGHVVSMMKRSSLGLVNSFCNRWAAN